MTFGLSIARTPDPRRVQHFFWLHPEWWTVVLCTFAWLVMSFHGWQHVGYGIHHRMPFLHELQMWLLMVTAMMLPFILPAVRATAAGSLWARRHRAITTFLAGYFMPWTALGIVAAALREGSWTHTYAAAAFGFASAALWQRTSLHTRAVSACHRILPLAPLGWKADRDALRFGSTIGVACVSSCWPLMLACTFAGHGPMAMGAGMALGAAERWSFRPRRRSALVIALAIAGYYMVLGGFDNAVITTCESPITSA
jgi:predicted metal-binding membrane protein